MDSPIEPPILLVHLLMNILKSMFISVHELLVMSILVLLVVLNVDQHHLQGVRSILDRQVELWVHDPHGPARH